MENKHRRQTQNRKVDQEGKTDAEGKAKKNRSSLKRGNGKGKPTQQGQKKAY